MNTPAVGAAVDYRYDIVLVALSFLISVLGSFVALRIVAAGDRKQDRSLTAAVALGGCGIWAMHFIGMTAYKTPLYVSYALLPTLVSLAVAVGITWLGFGVAMKGGGRPANLVMGGAVIGGGVVAMHYMGMFGMDLRASFNWNWGIVAASVAIALVAATAALWLAVNTRTMGQHAVSAVIMGIAVCAMHYTAMTAATMICTTAASRSDYSVDGPFLPYLTFGFALVFLGVSSISGRMTGAPAAAARA